MNCNSIIDVVQCTVLRHKRTNEKITKFWTHGKGIVKMENWKPVPNFDGYEVSDWGNVRSYKMKGGHGAYRVPHLLKATRKDRYRGVNLRCDGKTYFRRVASLVLLTFVGPRPGKMEVCHSNNNPHDNRLENLRYDTHANNIRDCLDLSDTQVIEMRERRARGEQIIDLAQEYNVGPGAAGEICRGIHYTEIGGPFTTSGRRGSLTIAEVVSIRERYAKGNITQQALGTEYNYSVSGIGLICRGLRYREDGGPFTQSA